MVQRSYDRPMGFSSMLSSLREGEDETWSESMQKGLGTLGPVAQTSPGGHASELRQRRTELEGGRQKQGGLWQEVEAVSVQVRGGTQWSEVVHGK